MIVHFALIDMISVTTCKFIFCELRVIYDYLAVLPYIKAICNSVQLRSFIIITGANAPISLPLVSPSEIKLKKAAVKGIFCLCEAPTKHNKSLSKPLDSFP